MPAARALGLMPAFSLGGQYTLIGVKPLRVGAFTSMALSTAAVADRPAGQDVPLSAPGANKGQ